MFEIAVYVSLIPFMVAGSYSSKSECDNALKWYRTEAVRRYNDGQRLNFLGKEINPKNVKASCREKKK